MLAPKLRHRITLQKQERVLSGGEYTLDWIDFLVDEPAAVEPLSGKQWVASQATQNSVDTRITIRWRDGIKASMRVIHGSDVYDVKVPLPDTSDRRWLTLMCTRGVGDGA